MNFISVVTALLLVAGIVLGVTLNTERNADLIKDPHAVGIAKITDSYVYPGLLHLTIGTLALIGLYLRGYFKSLVSSPEGFAVAVLNLFGLAVVMALLIGYGSVAWLKIFILSIGYGLLLSGLWQDVGTYVIGTGIGGVVVLVVLLGAAGTLSVWRFSTILLPIVLISLGILVQIGSEGSE